MECGAKVQEFIHNITAYDIPNRMYFDSLILNGYEPPSPPLQFVYHIYFEIFQIKKNISSLTVIFSVLCSWFSCPLYHGTKYLVHTTDVSNVSFLAKKNIHVKDINLKYFTNVYIKVIIRAPCYDHAHTI